MPGLLAEIRWLYYLYHDDTVQRAFKISFVVVVFFFLSFFDYSYDVKACIWIKIMTESFFVAFIVLAKRINLL